MLGEGMACDDDEDDAIDLCASWTSSVSAASAIQQKDITYYYSNYEDMMDYQSYAHNLSSCQIEAWKKIQAWTGFEPMTSAVAFCFLLKIYILQLDWPTDSYASLGGPVDQ